MFLLSHANTLWQSNMAIEHLKKNCVLICLISTGNSLLPCWLQGIYPCLFWVINSQTWAMKNCLTPSDSTAWFIGIPWSPINSLLSSPNQLYIILITWYHHKKLTVYPFFSGWSSPWICPKMTPPSCCVPCRPILLCRPRCPSHVHEARAVAADHRIVALHDLQCHESMMRQRIPQAPGLPGRRRKKFSPHVFWKITGISLLCYALDPHCYDMLNYHPLSIGNHVWW